MREIPVDQEPCEYEAQPGDTAVYRGRQWVVVANPKDPGGGYVLHNDRQWFNTDELGRHRPNLENGNVEYSMFSHIEGKGFDLDDWEEVYRFACAYFKIDTYGWLDKEIAHARAVRKYADAFCALETEMFPQPLDDSLRPSSFGAIHHQHDAVAAKLAHRGILDPNGPMGRNKLII